MRLFWAVALGLALVAGQAAAEEQKELKEKKDKVSYALGHELGNNFKRQGVEIDLDIFMRGMRDSMTGQKQAMSEEETRETMTSFNQEMMSKRAEETKKASEKNKKEGEEFLAGNMKKEGVKTLPSGLQYKVISEGAGRTPKATDTVTVNYRGTLLDGTEFDSSFRRGQPATFQVNGLIAGWTEALQLMKEGAKWQLFVPSKLAYGERGAGQMIGPNATLIFDIELISIK